MATLPARAVQFPVPHAPLHKDSWRYSFAVGLSLALTVVPNHQTDWPVPKTAERSIVLRTHADSFKLPLTTVKPPYTEYNWPNPRGYPPLNVGWTDRVDLPVIAATAGIPGNQFNWPVPRGYTRNSDLTWSDSFKLPLTTVKGFNQYDWPNPRGPRWTVDLVSWSQNGNKQQQEAPFVQRDWPNPLRAKPPVVLDWSETFALPLTTVKAPF